MRSSGTRSVTSTIRPSTEKRIRFLLVLQGFASCSRVTTVLLNSRARTIDYKHLKKRCSSKQFHRNIHSQHHLQVLTYVRKHYSEPMNYLVRFQRYQARTPFSIHSTHTRTLAVPFYTHHTHTHRKVKIYTQTMLSGKYENITAGLQRPLTYFLFTLHCLHTHIFCLHTVQHSVMARRIWKQNK